MFKKIFLTSTLTCASLGVQAMTLNEYIEAVKQSNLTYKAADAQANGSESVAREADLLTSPKLFAVARTSSDNLLSSPPFKVFNELQNHTFQVGVSQTFDFGLDLKLSVTASKYNFTEYTRMGSSNSSPKYWDAQPGVEFTLPLWAGGFGSLVKAQKVLTQKQNEADALANRSVSIQVLSEAENAYYNLSLAQDRVDIQKKALSSGRNILSFVTGQKNKNLGETADVLQARALVEAYELQLKQATNQLQRAERDFNKLLNKEVTASVEKLPLVNLNELKGITHPATRPGDRYDVLAQKAQIEITKASSDLILERNRPQLNLMGGYKVQGRDDNKALKAIGDSSNDYYNRYIGVQFSVPLNIKALTDARTGAQYLKDAASIRESNIEYTQDQDWLNLRSTLQETQDSLTLALAMERAQKAKLENERVRLRQGRTTTYQVLLFEQDYTNAQASTLAIATQIVALDSQLKLFVANPQGDK